MTRPATVRVGVISDTHGLLREGAIDLLRGSDCIVHAGDIGKPEILRGLAQVAAVTAVRGNNDKGPWAAQLRETELLQAGDLRIYVTHDIAELDIDPVAAGVDIVISGHSHVPRIEEKEGVLFVNPGSAGPRRFRLPVTVARIDIEGRKRVAKLFDVPIAATPPARRARAR